MPQLDNIESLFTQPSGIYLLEAENPVILESFITLLAGGPFFGIGYGDEMPINVAKDNQLFYWGPEAQYYFLFDNVYEEISTGLDSVAGQDDLVEKRVNQLLKKVGLKSICPYAKQISPWELSGGQQQRLLCALVLSRRYDMLISMNSLIYVEKKSRHDLYKMLTEKIRISKEKLLIPMEDRDFPDGLFDEKLTITPALHKILDNRERKQKKPLEKIQDCNFSNKQVIIKETILSIKDTYLKYPNGNIGINVPELELDNYSTYAVCGPNGGGKSSFLRLLISKEKIKGSISYKGKIQKRPFKDLVKKGIIRFTFQDPNVQIVGGKLYDFLSRTPESLDIIEDLQLSDYLNDDLLSSPLWVRQAALFASAISSNAEILVLDEPFDGMAYDIFGKQAIRFLKKKEREGSTLIIVTHNPELAKQITSKYLWVAEQKLWHSISINNCSKIKEDLYVWLSS